jgi:hypothetical protein
MPSDNALLIQPYFAVPKAKMPRKAAQQNAIPHLIFSQDQLSFWAFRKFV